MNNWTNTYDRTEFITGSQREKYVINLLKTELPYLDIRNNGYGTSSNVYYSYHNKTIERLAESDLILYYRNRYICHLEITGTDRVMDRDIPNLICKYKIRYILDKNYKLFVFHIHNIATNPRTVIHKVCNLTLLRPILNKQRNGRIQTYIVLNPNDILTLDIFKDHIFRLVSLALVNRKYNR